MAFGIGFFFGFDNTPSQLMGDLDAVLGIGGGGSAPLVPNPTPPVTPDNQATLAVEQATKRQELSRHTLQSTVHAGFGGWTPPQGPGVGSWPTVTGGRRG